ncbi:MAG: HAD family hydrolase [Niastella sp.]|uniref:HAD family hydrolase n=1 Tax=Niastella sp. TaxID=1869183 RepID=UPI00389A7C0B
MESINLNTLKLKIESPNIKIVSFDIFDTLICRPFLDPDALFGLMAADVNNITGKKVDFRSIRIAADGSARAASKQGDITLDHIYQQIASNLNIDTTAANKIKNLEIEYEKSILRKRSSVVEILEFAYRRGKRIILTSDMYLPKDTLKLILQNLGITSYHEFYLSNEVGLRKDSRTLFPYILEKENIAPDELLHVGDNIHSDIQIPQEIGVEVFHVKKPKELFLQTAIAKDIFNPRFQNSSHYSRIALAMGINKCFDDPFPKSNSLVNGDLQLFGYFYMGPLLLSFTKWVAETADKQKIDKLLFLSRDGEILYKIYQLLGKYSSQQLPQADYIQISRQTVANPYLEENNLFNKALTVPYNGDTLKNFFNTRFGINISYLNNTKLNEFGFEDLNAKVFLPQDFEKIKSLAAYVFQTSEKTFNTKRKNAIKYLKHKKLFGDSNQAVVDIGYSGSMQKFLNDISGKPIHGLYMITNQSIQTNIGRPGIFTKGLFGDNTDPSATTTTIEKYNLFYETILSSVKGSVKDYKLKLGKPQPVHENVGWEESEKVKKLPLIHQGILNFCEDFLSMFNSVDAIPYEELDLLQESFRHFLENPTIDDIIMFSGYSMDDHYCGNNIFYWVPTPVELQNKNYNSGKILWRQALSIIEAQEINKINELFDSHNARFGHLFNQPQSWYKKIGNLIKKRS